MFSKPSLSVAVSTLVASIKFHRHLGMSWRVIGGQAVFSLTRKGAWRHPILSLLGGFEC